MLFSEEYGQYYGQMNTMQAGRMMTVKRDGLPYEEMGYSAMPPPNRLVALLLYSYVYVQVIYYSKNFRENKGPSINDDR